MGSFISMNRADHTQLTRPKLGGDKIILGLLAVLIFGILFIVSSQQQQQLRSSPSGLNGLQVWLASEGLTARNFSGGWQQNVDQIGLLILPLYDTALDVSLTPAQSTEELVRQQDEYDLKAGPILSKIKDVPTLLVLPKWRSGMRLTGLAHPGFLVEQTRLHDTLNKLLTNHDARLRLHQQPFADFAYKSSGKATLLATIYAAQMFAARRCRPIIGTTKEMILGDCKLQDGTQVFVLSDPDLITNHGLALGDNAVIFRDFAAQLAQNRQIIIDYSRENWLTRESAKTQRDRTWSDLMRFFAPPFTVMWVGLIIAVALVLWRAGMRFGPLVNRPNALGASKIMAIGARARLMRRTGRDGALVAEYSKARLAAVATVLVGSTHASKISKPEAFLTYTKLRHPDQAIALNTALNTITALPQSASATQAMTAAAFLDEILEQIIYDTRNAAHSGR
ncbi:MAG: hypothetical protein ABJE99_04315 [Roseobacter sp.]